jgi:hypothetical protein
MPGAIAETGEVRGGTPLLQCDGSTTRVSAGCLTGATRKCRDLSVSIAAFHRLGSPKAGYPRALNSGFGVLCVFGVGSGMLTVLSMFGIRGVLGMNVNMLNVHVLNTDMLAMLDGMLFRGMFGMANSVQLVAMGNMGVVCGCCVIAIFRMLGGMTVVCRRVFEMHGGFVMVVMNLALVLLHVTLQSGRWADQSVDRPGRPKLVPGCDMAVNIWFR